jgi:hypothetical protein
MLNVTEVKQRCAGRDRQQSEPVKGQHVRDGTGRAAWGSFLIGVWFVVRARARWSTCPGSELEPGSQQRPRIVGAE